MTAEMQMLNDILLGIVLIVWVAMWAGVWADRRNRIPKNQFDAKRLADSVKALELIKQYLQDNPSIRLGQALLNLDVLQDDVTYTPNCPPRYKLKRQIIHEEPSVTLSRIEKALAKQTHGLD